MLFPGMKKASFLFLLVFSTFGEQYLGDQLKNKDVIDSLERGESSFVPSGASKVQFKEKKDKSSSMLPGGAAEKSNTKTGAYNFNNKIPFHKRSNNLVTFKNRDIFKNSYGEGKSALSFNYIQDNYQFKSTGGVFKRTFEDTAGSMRAGSLLIGYDNYFSKGSLNYFWGMNFGFGLSKGYGVFTQSAQTSDTRFTLWTLPLDLAIGMEVSVGKMFNLMFSGGPSAMGLIQTRDDKSSGEKYKYRRQISPGFFGMAKFRLSLGNIFSKSMFSLYSDYKVSNYYLDLVARFQNYENFQDELSITGSSFGVGLSFDTL